MSNLRHELFVGATPEELKGKTNSFLAQPNIELKQFDYETDGYEKPYSASILYHDKSHGQVEQDDAPTPGFWKRLGLGR